MSLLRAAAKRFEANRPPGRLLGRDGAAPPRKATRRSLAGGLGGLGGEMVTYEGLFAFCMLIVSIIALFQSNKK